MHDFRAIMACKRAIITDHRAITMSIRAIKHVE